MKKFLIMLSIVAMVMLVSITANAMDGLGTAQSPYLIENTKDFLTIGYYGDKYYKLLNDISVTDVIPEFSGELDGNGHSISTQNDYIFSSNKGTVKNLIIDSENLVDINMENGCVMECSISNGVLIATNNGVVKSCSSSNYEGKMIDINNGTIKNCKAEKGNLTTTNNGFIENSSVETEYTSYIAYENYGVIKSCTILNSEYSAITHRNFNGAIVSECLAINGIISEFNYGRIQNSSSSGCGLYAGIVIENYGDISESFSTKTIIGGSSTTANLGLTSKLGGIAAFNDTQGKISNCYYDGYIRQENGSLAYLRRTVYVGGIVGFNYGTINGCYSKGDIYASVHAKDNGTLNLYIGGISAKGGQILDSYSQIDIQGFGRCDDCTGGGCFVSGISNSSEISNCYFSGTLGVDSYTVDVFEKGIGDSFENSYYESKSPYSESTEYGIPLPNLMMKEKSNYTGWNFETVWGINTLINDGYPYLIWQNFEMEDDVISKVESISFDKRELHLNMGDVVYIKTTILPEEATNKNVIWKSSDTMIAVVDNGNITAMGAGTALITATTEDGGHSALCSVLVEENNESETVVPENPQEPTESNGDDKNILTLRVEIVTGRAGESITVPLYVEKNTGIAGMQLTLSYDENLQLTSLIQSKGQEDSALETLVFTSPGNLSESTLTLPWYGLDADSTNGKILEMTFTIPEDAVDGTRYNIGLSYTKGNIFDNDLNDVDAEIVNGSISVKNYTIGDINDDGIINIKDITILARGIAGGYGVVLGKSADVNGDDIINTKDITILSRYIAGGYGIELEK